MADTTANSEQIALGAGAIISESFSILFGNLIKIMGLGFIAAFGGFLINGLLIGFGPALGVADPNFVGTGAVVNTLLSTVISMIVYGFTIALLVQLAYDAKLGRSNSFSSYVGPALKGLIPIAILSIVIGILTGLGAIALLIGAVWVYAVFIATVPAVVIEQSGFGAMSRSSSLTKGYRWPIVGVLIVVWISVIVLQLILGGVIGVIAIGAAGSTMMLLLFGVIASLVGAIGYGLAGISSALIYARLREIKEGVSVDEISSVFE